MFFLNHQNEIDSLKNYFECLICLTEQSNGYEIQKDIFPYCQVLFSKKLQKEEGRVCEKCISQFSPKFFQQRIDNLKNEKQKNLNFDERIESLSYEGLKNILKECLQESFSNKVDVFIQNEFKTEVLRFQEDKIDQLFYDNFLILENFLMIEQEDKLSFFDFLADEIWNNINSILEIAKMYKENVSKSFDISATIFHHMEKLNLKIDNLEFNFWISNGINHKMELLHSIYFLLNSMLKKNGFFDVIPLLNLLSEFDDMYILREFMNSYKTIRTFKLIYQHVLFEKFQKSQNFEHYKFLVETTSKKEETKYLLAQNIKQKDILFQVLVDEKKFKKIDHITSHESVENITRFSKGIAQYHPNFIYSNGQKMLFQLLDSLIKKINTKDLSQTKDVSLFNEWIDFIKISCGIRKIYLKRVVILKDGEKLWKDLIEKIKDEVEENLNFQNYEIFQKENQDLTKPIQDILSYENKFK
eukprot:gene12919-7430_t